MIVTSKFLNGAQQIYFDGQSLDWHYAPINSADLQRGGVSGLDSVYVTVGTDQVEGGTPVTGNKSFMGLIKYGDSSNSNGPNAPLSYNTNTKFNTGGDNQTFTAKYANLVDQDVVTKLVLTQQITNFPIIDQGSF